MSNELNSGNSAPDSSENAPPPASLDQIIEKLHTSWTNGDAGHTRTWAGSTVHYSMPNSAPTNYPNDPYPTEQDTQVTMSTVMKNSARLAFELWDDLIAINLTESVNDPAADITLAYASDTGGTYATPVIEYGANGDDTLVGGQVWCDSDEHTQNDDADFFFGGYGFQTYMHEIGHALGLSHPGQYNGSADYDTDAEFAQDNRQYTIMSYFGGYSLSQDAWTQDEAYSTNLFSSTPMLYDIAAIQAKYGADYTTRAGNTTYGFNSNAGRAVYDFNQDPDAIFAIWDGGGTDWLDTSGFSDDQYINLGEGTYSSVGGMTGNVAIAYGVTIENAKGGYGWDYIQGNAADNVIWGLGDDDFLYGMGGDDTLDGGYGADQMYGGGGDDTYWVNNVGDYVEETAVFNGDDKVYSSVDYTLPEKVEVLTLLSGASNGTGNSGVNEINGNAGNNILDGKAGADIMSGGQGADTFYVDDINDQVIEASTPEIDTVYASLTYTLGTNVENLVLQGDALYGTGNAADNVITGNEFYNELFGLEGNDTLAGGGGLNELHGGAGDDTYVLGSDNSAHQAIIEVSGFDTITSTVGRSLTTYLDVEKLVLEGAGNINATGNALFNVLIGNSGDNGLNGGDSLDVLEGGLGNDTYFLGADNDIVTDTGGTDTISSSVSRSLANYAAIERLVLEGGDNINATGNNMNNVLFGNSGDNVLTGGLGIDSLSGGLGNDSFVLENGTDGVTDTGGFDTILSTVGRSLAGFATIERLILQGLDNINGIGNDLVNVLIGNGGDNALNGGAGIDSLDGGLGNDTYVLDADADTIADTGGFDTISSTITRSLTSFADIERLVLGGSSDINGTGNGFGNTLIGNAGKNVLNGGDGGDTLTGGAGRDVFFGEIGADRFDFNAAADSGANANTRDVIRDFAKGQDIIDLATIDANGAAAGDAFAFIGSGAFSGVAGQLHWFQIDAVNDAQDITVVEADIDGNLIADFQIGVTGLINLAAADFAL
jgi:Ca2+-binding RTX toxin-like protein